MTAWWNGPILAFDLETTSANPEDARIVSAAIVSIQPGEKPETRTWLVNPGVEISEEAIAIHGITNEQAQADGMDPAVAIQEIVDVLAWSGHRGDPLAIQNARYDLTVTDREKRRYGIQRSSLTSVDFGPVIDPLLIDKHLDRYRKGSRKLDAICAHYGARMDDAHDAGNDALAAARAAWVIADRGVVIRKVWNAKMGAELAYLKREWERVRYDPLLLQEAQVQWAYEQAVGLQEHFRKTDPEAVVETAWPLVPVST